MERYIVIALLVGMVIGAGSATALSSQAPIAAEKQGTAWSAHHAAIQDDGVAREPAPTF
jgi:hypothetical protein